MIDALGAPQSVLVLGATSDIATATVERLAGLGRLRRLVLAARPSDALSATATRFAADGREVETVPMDALDSAQVVAAVDTAFAGGDIDVVLLAFGVLPQQAPLLDDPAAALDVAQVNYTAGLAGCLAAGRHLRAQGHGVLVVLSSVAGQRARRSNFVYGSTKAGLDAVATGLGDELHGSGASVLVVRPGIVHSAMTAGLDAAPLATTPQAVADAIAANLTRGSRTIWVPRALRPVMGVLGVLPRAVFRRLPI